MKTLTIGIEPDGTTAVHLDGIPMAAVEQVPPPAPDAVLESNAVEIVRHDTPREVVIAIVCHEAHRLYCVASGMVAPATWQELEGELQSSAIEGVRGIMNGSIRTPADGHELWRASKLDAGWQYGPTKSFVAKTHPDIVPYADLSESHRKKRQLFHAIASTLLL